MLSIAESRASAHPNSSRITLRLRKFDDGLGLPPQSLHGVNTVSTLCYVPLDLLRRVLADCFAAMLPGATIVVAEPVPGSDGSGGPARMNNLSERGYDAVFAEAGFETLESRTLHDSGGGEGSIMFWMASWRRPYEVEIEGTGEVNGGGDDAWVMVYAENGDTGPEESGETVFEIGEYGYEEVD